MNPGSRTTGRNLWNNVRRYGLHFLADPFRVLLACRILTVYQSESDKMSRNLLAVYFSVLFTVSSSTLACGPIDRTAQIRINLYAVTVELAVSAEEKTCGLSFRDSLPEDHGMLFVFFDDRRMTFWMKDTRIPLSIAFLDAKGTILNILEMNPMDTTALYRSSSPARYALEMPANWFAEHQVKPGDWVAIPF